MPQFLCNLPVVANGNILPSVFVTMDPTRDNAVIQSSGTTMPIGVSQVGPYQAPNLIQSLGAPAAPQYAAIQGLELGIYTVGDVCGLTVGSAGVTSGDFLTNDPSGAAATAAPGSNKYFGAIALQSGTSGAIIDVLVAYGKA